MNPERAAVFLDRDGVINEQMGYVNHVSRFVLLPGVAAAIGKLNRAGVLVLVATSQSGLARGYFPASLLHEVHELMRQQLAGLGAHLDGISVCPHHPEAKEALYRQDCDCRKPKPGLVLRAAGELGLDLLKSYMVGDRWTDIRCGAAAGLKTVLVRTGYGRGEELYIGPQETVQPETVQEDLAAAVDWILHDMRQRGILV